MAGLSKRIRDHLESKGLWAVAGPDGKKPVGMLPMEVSNELGVTASKERDTVCMLMRQMTVDGMLERDGPPRGRRYLLVRNPLEGAEGRRMSRDDFLAKRRGYNEQARRRRGSLPREQRAEVNRRLREETRAKREAERLAAKQARAAARAAERAAAPPKKRVRPQAKRMGRLQLQPARAQIAQIAPPKPVYVSSEDFVRQFAHDPGKFERLPITACRAPLRKSLETA